MRVGVIRGDLPGPLFLADLETVSQQNPPTEPRGQELYLSRPTTDEVEAVLADATTGAGAVVQGSDIIGTFPLTINGANDDLRIKLLAADSFTAVSIVQAVYATFDDFLEAVQDALATLDVTVFQGTGSGSRIAIESNVHGVDSYLEVDTTGNGSTANTPLGIAGGGVVRDMPSASDFITDLLPVDGPLDVSLVTINAVGSSNNANALSLIPTDRGTQTLLADALAPRLVETPVAIDSFLVGMISQLLSANFNPDSRRVPAITSGPAIEVVEDDGSTTFGATLPTITSATLDLPGVGDVTIVGTGLGNAERLETVVKFTGDVVTKLQQSLIEHNGGSVSDTEVVVPAALIDGVAVTTTSVQVQVRQRASAVEVLV